MPCVDRPIVLYKRGGDEIDGHRRIGEAVKQAPEVAPEE
jgi:hypothetical protein